MPIETSYSPLPKLPGSIAVGWEAGDPITSCIAANDNDPPWFPNPTTMTLADAVETDGSRSRNLKGKILVVAYAVAASIAVISWICLIGASLLGGATWVLDL